MAGIIGRIGFTAVVALVIAFLPLVSAGLVVQNGAMNSSSNFYVGNGSFFANATSGFVGIGSVSPGRPLHVVAAQDANIRLQDTSGSPAAYIEFYNDTSRWGYVGLGGHDDKMVIGTTAEKNLTFYTNDSTKMTLTATGNLGVGITGPEGLLHVAEPDFADLALFERTGATTDGVWAGARILATKTTNMTDGFGTAVSFNIRDDAGVINNIGLVGAVRDGADNLGAIFFQNYGGSSMEKMRITSEGRVGIGTSSPTQRLDVAGVVNAYGFTVNGSAFTGSGNGTSQWTTSGSNIYYSAGNVGIGTASPSSILHVNGSASAANFAIKVENTAADGFSTIQFYDTNAGIYRNGPSQSSYFGASSLMIGTVAAHNFGVITSNTARMVVTSAGNVGIGTTSPAYKLDVAGNVNVGSGYGFCINGACTTNFGTTNYWSAGTGGIYNSGSVGVGTSSPGAKLEVNGGTADSITLAKFFNAVDATGESVELLVGKSVGSGQSGRIAYVHDSTTADNRYVGIGTEGGGTPLVVTYGGKVGIGTTSPDEKLTIIAPSGSTGGISIYDGSVSASNYAVWLGDGSSSGKQGVLQLFDAGTRTILLSGGAADSSYINTSKFGIGTVGPQSKLEVTALNSSVAIGGSMGSPAASQTGIQFLNYGVYHVGLRYDGRGNLTYESAGSSVNPMLWYDGQPANFIVRNGNVGIGTTSPQQKLVVRGNLTVGHEWDGATTTMPVYFGKPASGGGFGAGSAFMTFVDAGSGAGVNYGTSIAFTPHKGGSAQTEAMRIAGNGNVGIGNSTPAAQLHIQDPSSTGVVRIQGAPNANAGAALDLYSSGNNANQRNWRLHANVETAGDFEILQSTSTTGSPAYGSGVARFYISPAGNVGIGTTAPVAKLSIRTTDTDAATYSIAAKTTGTNYGVDAEAVGSGATTNVGGYFAASGATSNYAIIVPSGYGSVGIGTTTPSYTLTVAGTAWVTSGAWSGSDSRWKRNVAALSPSSSLDKILALRPVNFEWKADEYPQLGFTNGIQVGFIAQDVEKVIPELVTTDDKGYKGMSYEKLTPVLTGAVQEQQSQIEGLKSQVSALKEGNELLKELVCADHPQAAACK